MLRCTPQKDSIERVQIAGSTSHRLPIELVAERAPTSRFILKLAAGSSSNGETKRIR